jgi:hypothetical protein
MDRNLNLDHPLTVQDLVVLPGMRVIVPPMVESFGPLLEYFHDNPSGFLNNVRINRKIPTHKKLQTDNTTIRTIKYQITGIPLIWRAE